MFKSYYIHIECVSPAFLVVSVVLVLMIRCVCLKKYSNNNFLFRFADTIESCIGPQELFCFRSSHTPSLSPPCRTQSHPTSFNEFRLQIVIFITFFIINCCHVHIMPRSMMFLSFVTRLTKKVDY